jgi:hypothetical protein
MIDWIDKLWMHIHNFAVDAWNGLVRIRIVIFAIAVACMIVMLLLMKK